MPSPKSSTCLFFKFLSISIHFPSHFQIFRYKNLCTDVFKKFFFLKVKKWILWILVANMVFLKACISVTIQYFFTKIEMSVYHDLKLRKLAKKFFALHIFFAKIRILWGATKIEVFKHWIFSHKNTHKNFLKT